MPDAPRPARSPDAAGAALLGVFSGIGLAGGAAATGVGGVLAWIGWVTFGWGEGLMNGDNLYAVFPGMFLALFALAAGLLGAVLAIGGVVVLVLGGLGAWAAARTASPR